MTENSCVPMGERVQHDSFCPHAGRESGAWCVFCDLIWRVRDDALVTAHRVAADLLKKRTYAEDD